MHVVAFDIFEIVAIQAIAAYVNNRLSSSLLQMTPIETNTDEYRAFVVVVVTVNHGILCRLIRIVLRNRLDEMYFVRILSRLGEKRK